MKINVEIELNVDIFENDALSEFEIKQQVQDHFEEFLTNDEPDIQFNQIKVPSNKCWDCYSYIDLLNIKIL